MAHIKTYARIKPTSKPSKHLEHESINVAISVPQLQPSGQTRDRTATLTHQFGFSGVFGPTSTQEEVFDTVASHIVDGFLSGYNGTIFAYGQTGSGKTYTIEGGARSYSDRGLAPRALSRIYKSLENQKFDDLSIKVSYLEIYQEVGYDLLNPTTRPGNVVTHLPKVSVTDGPNNSCMVRNLSLHLAADERVAQSLLLQGQANRKVAETPMNQRSSRSHAVFTIYIKARPKGSHAFNKSKLHLVDLAGSERVAKTKIAGQQLHEAKSINLSLHHLEGVIIALQGGHGEGSRVRGRRRALSAGPVRNRRIGSASSTRSLPYHRSMSMGGHRHIPYRNSLLTMVLRDSLGGNCLTAMVATISAEAINLSESLSTCRFAMRVAAVQNKVSRNEVIDDKTIIERLRKRIVSLEEEIRVLKSRITEHDCPKITVSQDFTPHHHPSDSTTGTTPITSSSPSSMKAPSSLANTPKPVVVPANGSGLTREGRQLCARLMQGFVSGRVTDPVAAGVSDFSRFRECLRILREMIHRSYAYHQKYNPTMPSDQQLGSKVKRSEEQVPDVKRSPRGGSAKVKPATNNEKGHSRGYKSPFERKREKEISRLTKNVETQIAEQKQQRKDLMEFKTLLKQQQLENAVRDLSNKIMMTSSHLEKQQELVENLRQCKASREQITAERVAEKQLAKRLAKYEKRYELAQEHLQIVKNHMELQERVSKARHSTNQNSCIRESFINQPESRADPSSQSETVFHSAGQMSPRVGILQGDNNVHNGLHPFDQSEVTLHRSPEEDDQSGRLTDRIKERCRHKSGRVDSRRVLDILQQEDSKRSKLAKEIKEERIKNFTQHFALKEEATLTKLQHFKQQLKKQQEAERATSNPAGTMRQSCDGHVNTAWSDDGIRSGTVQSEEGQGDPPGSMRQSCDGHVNTAWSADGTRSGTVQSEEGKSDPAFSLRQSCDGHVNTAWPDNATRSGTIQSEEGRSHSAFSVRQSCDSHVNTAWPDNIRTGRPTTSQSGAFIPTVVDSDSGMGSDKGTVLGRGHIGNSSMRFQASIVSLDSEIQRTASQSTSPAHQKSSKENSQNCLHISSKNDNQHSALEANVNATPVMALHAPNEQHVQPPAVRPLELTAVTTEDSTFQEGDTTSVQSSNFIVGSIATMQSSSSPSLSTLQSSPFFAEDAESRPHKQASTVLLEDSTLFNEDSRTSSPPSEFSSTAGLSCTEDGPAIAHSAASLFLKTPGLPAQPTGQPVTEPRRSSFDEALSSMLHRDGSKVKSVVPQVTKPQDQGDVTLALKSKLLDYLGGKPLRGPSVNSMNSLQDDWSRSSINRSCTGSSMLSDTFKGSSVNSVCEGSSISDAFERSSVNSALEGSSVSSAFTGSSINNALSRTEDFTPYQAGHTRLEGRDTKGDAFVSAKHPTFQLGASSSTLNSIGEEESILARGEGETSRDIFQNNQSIRSVDHQEVSDNVGSEVKAMEEAEGQRSYLSAAKDNKERIKKIRKAIHSAEVIQRAWRKYHSQRK